MRRWEALVIVYTARFTRWLVSPVATFHLYCGSCGGVLPMTVDGLINHRRWCKR